MTGKNPEREKQSLLQWKRMRFIPKAFQNQGQRLLLSFVQEHWICQGLQWQTARHCPPYCVCGWETGSQRQGPRRDASKCSVFPKHIPGMERAGRKLDGRTDTKTLWGGDKSKGRSWTNTNAKEENEKKSWSVFLLHSPSPLRTQSQDWLPPPAAQPRSCSLGTAPGQPSPAVRGTQLPRAGIQPCFFKLNLALISGGFRGIRGRTSCSCLVFRQVRDIFSSFCVERTWILIFFF